MLKKFSKTFLFLSVTVLLAFSSVFAQKVPTPQDFFGFTPGDDRKLASWNQILSYFQKLEDTSPRVKFEALGKTTLDAPFVYAAISSPANLKQLEFYKKINQKLADPRLIRSNDAVAKSLIKQGKTIVLVTCGIHSTEVGSTLSSTLIAHRLATSNEPEVLKILNETIVLLVPSLNPDGVDIVKKWYDKTLGTPFEGTDPPELYHHYTGHDNNRDWYAFTQVETKMTVDKLHNVWHPQIVNDIHQQGAFGARLFLPPYTKPVEPNVPKAIVDGYTELGSFIADEMRKEGFSGITTNSTYDAWTPARAYSHYHAGVRILSETASARLATPINIEFDKLRGDIGYDAKKESANFSPVWKGGTWKLSDIVKYMTTSNFHLLKHAADNREKWLTRFYAIGKEAVKPRKKGEVLAYIIDSENSRNHWAFNRILSRAGVEIENVTEFSYDGRKFPNNTSIIKMNQPYSAFVTAMVEPQGYPDLFDEKGQPIPPYDVTAHNLALLMDVKLIPLKTPLNFSPPYGEGRGTGGGFDTKNLPVKALYKSYQPSMDEGWTRFVMKENRWFSSKYFETKSIVNQEIREGKFPERTETIIFPDSSPKFMLNGHEKGTMPEEYTGGINKEGVENLRKFAENGGTLVFLNRSSDFAIEHFNLPVKNVTQGLNRKEFYIPGSILRTKINTSHQIAGRTSKTSIAWFENSPAFEVLDKSKVEVIAEYPEKTEDILLSGWALGQEKLAGKAALVAIPFGRGKIVLFGFRPQYRGQSFATFPLFFNAINY